MQCTHEDTMNTDHTELRLSAAIMAPEDCAIPSQPPHRTGSLTATIASLAVGKTASHVVPVHPDYSLSQLQGMMATLRDDLRNNVTSCVRNAKRTTGGEYSIEVDDHFTSKGRLFILALVTRVA